MNIIIINVFIQELGKHDIRVELSLIGREKCTIGGRRLREK